MTISYNLGTVMITPISPRKKWNEEKNEYEDDFKSFEVGVDWVSHGNYFINYPKDDYEIREKKDMMGCYYIPMESEYFDEILEALKSTEFHKTRDKVFEPFWKAVLPPRGMHFFETQLQAYFLDEKKGSFVLQSRSFMGKINSLLDSVEFRVEDFIKLKDIAFNSKEDRPVHYCQIG